MGAVKRCSPQVNTTRPGRLTITETRDKWVPEPLPLEVALNESADWTTTVRGVLTGCAMGTGMGRAQRRAEDRQEAKRKRTSEIAARESSQRNTQQVAGESPETPDETARRIYRTGSQPERRGKKARRAIEKPLKWREGRQ